MCRICKCRGYQMFFYEVTGGKSDVSDGGGDSTGDGGDVSLQ